MQGNLKKKIHLLFILPYVKGLSDEIASGGSKSTVNILIKLSKKFDVSLIIFKKTPSSDILQENYGINVMHTCIPYMSWQLTLIFCRLSLFLISKFTKNLSVDYVITMRGTIIIGSNYKNINPNVKHFIFTRAYEDLQIMRLYKLKNSLSLNRQLESIIFKNSYLNSYLKSDLVVVNSVFLKNKFNKLIRNLNDIKVLYPPININSKIIKSEIKYIKRMGFINKGINKGEHLVSKLACYFPDIDFYIYGIKINSITTSNIHYKGYVYSHLELYSELDILLVPSIWEEPYGRVASEALSHGVIPIVSSLGGLPESAISNLFVVKSLSVNAWKNKIHNVINNLNHYNDQLLLSFETLRKRQYSNDEILQSIFNL